MFFSFQKDNKVCVFFLIAHTVRVHCIVAVAKYRAAIKSMPIKEEVLRSVVKLILSRVKQRCKTYFKLLIEATITVSIINNNLNKS